MILWILFRNCLFKIKEKIDSDAFFGGRYVGKVIEIDSSTSGAETEENIQKLLTIEKNTNPIEIVLHVYKLKEGWDVNNLFTIIPLNAAKSDILALQTIGRGLRLPFGEITGIEELDTLDIVAHDHYREIVDDIKNNPVFKKRVLRICRKKKIQSYIKHRYNCCTKPASDPAYVAENILNREFKSDRINQKWVTDVSEFKYGVGEDDKKGKLYLSVILDLCDRRPVAFVYSTRNDTSLVFDTFDKAVAANPGATPLLHSDRGYQYTSKAFRRRILAAGMTQSMSRVARCIDNGPMEGFWGLMKREMYYGKKYKTKEELMLAIEKYIDYYTNKRVQLQIPAHLTTHSAKS